ncbi:hypothetical protein [Halocatena pleomorpha]|uniref:Uncharacterized protein n=1 Tax=Halocatena pleomorpha TaxID=1785090 RepID=A0A3P3R8T7_9EURY|nr:hypothetical protein [Halocatena pleomorpha]RRJ28953.1 hypothetical protein EIK79_14670 [Halocatena pleomorpha]
MPSHQNKGVQFVGGFLASVMVAYWIRRRDAGERKIKAQIYGAIGNAIGLFVGCKLAERAEQ